MKIAHILNGYPLGMQRFGTAIVPTHSIGLALLQSDWQKAISLLLQHRPGEHPDIVAAREAWLKEGDLEKALFLMPRRVVAERCILESFKKMNGDTRNAMGALSTVCVVVSYLHDYISNDAVDSAQPSTNVCPCIPIVCVERYCVRTIAAVWGRQASCWRFGF